MASTVKTNRVSHPRTQNDHRRYATSLEDLPELLAATIESTAQGIASNEVQSSPTENLQPETPESSTGIPVPPGSIHANTTHATIAEPQQNHDEQESVREQQWTSGAAIPPGEMPTETTPTQQNSPAADSSLHETNDEPQHWYDPLVDQLTDSVCADYRLLRMKRPPRTPDAVMGAYDKARQQLKTLRGQMRWFPSSYTRALIDARGAENCDLEERTRLLDDRVNNILARVEVPEFVPSAKRLQAEYFTALTAKELFVDLRQELIAETRKQIRTFVQMLDAMRLREIVGQFTFSHPNGTSLHFHRFPSIFRTELWPNATPQYSTTTAYAQHVTGRSTGSRGGVVTTTIEKTQHGLEHREAKHEIEMSNPRCRELRPNRLRKAPQYVHDVIACVPDAFAPHLRILMGTKVDGDVSERKAYTESWYRTKTTQVIHPDPAIFLDRFVLVGWYDD